MDTDFSGGFMANLETTEQMRRVFIKEPESEYHAKAKENLSSHALADFRKCPFLYIQKMQGLIPDEDRPAYLIGRAAHVLILEGSERFDAEYVVGGPINPKTGKPYGSTTQAYAEWAAAQGKDVLTDDHFAVISKMVVSVRSHKLALELISSGIPEGVLRAEYCGVPCQSRLDFYNPEKGIIDLKTCDDLGYFEADSRRYGYVYQLAFYHALLTHVTGEIAPVFLIAVEKKPPFRCGVWRLGEDVLGTAQKENEQAIERLKKCRKAESWPTGYEALRTFDWI
jgi:hypothetical protein